ncbi:MAG: signal peptidase II [Verrucomicrobiota bacterium]|nr:signal peptidase II [Verrucomicrobiota bacterium]
MPYSPQTIRETPVPLRHATAHQRTSLMTRLLGYSRFWVYLFVVLALDLVTKEWVQYHSGFPHGLYPPEGGAEVIPGFISIVFTTNLGAAWGLFAGFSIFLVALAVVALFAIYGFRKHLELDRPLMQAGFGLMVAGILGNLIDRLRFGYVVDFLDVHLSFYRWPTFNIADSAIFCGVGLYLFWSVKADFAARRKAKQRPVIE